MMEREKTLKKIKLMVFILIIIFALMAIISYRSAYKIKLVNTSKQFLPPSIDHIFGTDLFGRDVFLRTIRGFLNAFLIAIVSWLIAFGLGIILGIFVAYKGGFIDEIFFYISNMIFSIPTMIIAIYLASQTSSRIIVLIFLISFSSVFYNAKIVRSHIQGLMEENFIIELRLLGAGFWHICANHLLREAVINLLPIMPLMVGHMILSISAFSFLGFGIQAPEAEIGLILNENFTYISIAPWACVLPGLFQFIMIFALSILGDLIRKYYVRGGYLNG